MGCCGKDVRAAASSRLACSVWRHIIAIMALVFIQDLVLGLNGGTDKPMTFLLCSETAVETTM